MKTTPVLDILNPPAGAIPATEAQLIALGLTPADITAGEKRGEMKTRGAWSIPVSYRALVETKNFTGERAGETPRARFWPARTMSAPVQSGHELEGRVSLGGKKISAFTSSQLFELPDGRLIDCATIFVRLRD
jgi:hypothetical protein